MDKVRAAQEKKRVIEVQNRKMKYFLVHKWDFLKEKRKQYEEFALQLRKKRTWCRKWHRLMQTQGIIQYVFRVFQARQKEVMGERKR